MDNATENKDEMTTDERKSDTNDVYYMIIGVASAVIVLVLITTIVSICHKRRAVPQVFSHMHFFGRNDKSLLVSGHFTWRPGS